MASVPGTGGDGGLLNELALELLTRIAAAHGTHSLEVANAATLTTAAAKAYLRARARRLAKVLGEEGLTREEIAEETAKQVAIVFTTGNKQTGIRGYFGLDVIVGSVRNAGDVDRRR